MHDNFTAGQLLQVRQKQCACGSWLSKAGAATTIRTDNKVVKTAKHCAVLEGGGIFTNASAGPSQHTSS
jgi:hypothetical protein